MRGFGRLHAVGVEGTGSYGAGLARYLRGQDVRVVEVNRPDRRQRRAKGKSDPLDAYAAAEAVLAGRATTVPKAGDGIVESIRALHLVRASAVKARTACTNEMKALVVTAPAELREQLPARAATGLAQACSRLQPHGDLADPAGGVTAALRRLAARYQALTAEIADADAQLAVLVKRPDPTCWPPAVWAWRPPRNCCPPAATTPTGCTPRQRSPRHAGYPRCQPPAERPPATDSTVAATGKPTLYMIVITRMGHDAATRAYVARRTAEGLSTKEIIRCLKRYLARDLYKILIGSNTSNQDLPAAA
jgi:transposase